MKTRYYTVEDLMLMGKLETVGIGAKSLKIAADNQLTIFTKKDVMDKQMSFYNLMPKKENKRKVKKLLK